MQVLKSNFIKGLYKNLTTAIASFVAVIFIYTILFVLNIILFDIQHFKAINLNNELSNSKKYKIGIITPAYNSGEIAAANYACYAANKLGWDCYTLSCDLLRAENFYFAAIYKAIFSIVNFFNKNDFIIYGYLFPKDIVNTNTVNFAVLTFNKTRDGVLIDIPVEEKLDVSKYDGYLTYSPNMNLIKTISTKQFANINLWNSKPLITIYPVNMSDYKELNFKHFFYSGNNWDNLRNSKYYRSILTKLDSEMLLEVYGPSEAWEFIKNAYKGEVYGDEYLQKMQNAGIALVLHSKYHLNYGIPSNRIFEAAAAGTLIVSDYHPFVEKHFGNCALYADFTKPAEIVFKQLKEHLQWAQDFPMQALQKTKCAHDVFKKHFTMEQSLLDIAKIYKTLKVNKITNANK